MGEASLPHTESTMNHSRCFGSLALKILPFAFLLCSLNLRCRGIVDVLIGVGYLKGICSLHLNHVWYSLSISATKISSFDEG